MKQRVWSLQVSHFGVSAVPYVKGATGVRLLFILFISISAKEAFIRATVITGMKGLSPSLQHQKTEVDNVSVG